MRRRRGVQRVLAASVLLAGAAVAVAPPAAATVPVGSAAGCPAVGYGTRSVAPGTGRTVALTFDDGPGPSTGAILAVLKAKRVRATFFNVGTHLTTTPGPVLAEVNSGFAVGNHTWSHPQLTTLGSAAQAAQLDRANAAEAAVAGRLPCLFRPPYGSYDTATLTLAQQRRMAVWTWSVDTEDWKANGSGSAYWVARITSRAEAGAGQLHPVILMHNHLSGNPATVAALGPVIDFYRARGYQFVDLLGRGGYPVGSPFGAYDRLSRWPGGLRVDGWAIDPDTAAATTVDLYVSGTGAGRYRADASRPDVGRAYPGYGPAHGVAVTVAYRSAGARSVCLYAVNTAGGGDDRLLGCRSITVSNVPFGHLDAATSSAGAVTLAGWALDPDTAAPVAVVATVDGVAQPARLADASRPDVARAFPGWGDRHGFRWAVPAAPGAHRVCVVAVNAGPGTNRTVGCADVRT